MLESMAKQGEEVDTELRSTLEAKVAAIEREEKAAKPLWQCLQQTASQLTQVRAKLSKARESKKALEEKLEATKKSLAATELELANLVVQEEQLATQCEKGAQQAKPPVLGEGKASELYDDLVAKIPEQAGKDSHEVHQQLAALASALAYLARSPPPPAAEPPSYHEHGKDDDVYEEGGDDGTKMEDDSRPEQPEQEGQGGPKGTATPTGEAKEPAHHSAAEKKLDNQWQAERQKAFDDATLECLKRQLPEGVSEEAYAAIQQEIGNLAKRLKASG